MEHGARIFTGPFALNYGNIGDLLDRHVVFLAVAQDRKCEHGRRAKHAVGQLELPVPTTWVHRRSRLRHVGTARLAMRDQHGTTEAFIDRGCGVPQVDQEGGAANRGAVDPGRGDAEIVGHLCRLFTAAGDTIDVARLEPGIGHRVQRRVRV